MRFTFLGTGTSAGVPAIACGCRVCTSADPRDRRLRTGGVLEFIDAQGQYRVVLIDCTPDLRQQALRAGLRRCDAVVFTHNHVDHTWGVDELRRFNVVQRAPIEVYAEQNVMDHLRRVYKHIFDQEHNVNKSFVATLIPFVIDPEKPLDLFGVRFTPIRLLHGRLPILGFRIERAVAKPGEEFLPLAYCTDVSAIPPESWKLFRGMKTLVIDALRKRHHPTHFTLEQAVNAADRIGAASSYFVHMSHDMKHDETNAELPAGMALAYDGQTLGSIDLPKKPAPEDPGLGASDYSD
jgi:phosphoribosyl 1,2-cyclic phosphate phosphodiesterase